jgi:guanylate kinase
MRQRLVDRGTENEKTLTTRIGNVKGELKTAFSKSHIFCYRIVNGDLDIATQSFCKVIEALYTEELGM